MTEKELTDFCLSLPGADGFSLPTAPVALFLRHAASGKWFGFIHHLNGRLCITLKLEPMEALALRQRYEGVGPGWHMNKLHWNTVDVCADVPKEDVEYMIRQSHALTAPKPAKKPKEQRRIVPPREMW